STNLNASAPRRPPGSEVTCKSTPLERRRSGIAPLREDEVIRARGPGLRRCVKTRSFGHVYPDGAPGYFQGMTSATELVTGAASRADAKPARGRQRAPARIVIQYPSPSVDEGRYPAKRCVGDEVRVEADIFRDGHELLRAVVRYRGPGAGRWREVQMRQID